MNDIKILSGIDTLYYFCQSNENYVDLFYEIQEQLDEIKGKFDKLELDYENSDINIIIEDNSFNYLGKSEGFYWFRDLNDFFKIGFKDNLKNRNLHDIRVQLLGNGIYRVGIKRLLSIINDELLKDYTTKLYPITRADLNCFVEYDFSFLSKEMFVTRKRQYSTINEIGSAKSLQTIYVGKEPFKLRIYNKSLEMKKSKKYDLMCEYFLSNNFDLEKSIFNVEFQLNRQHLRMFNIENVEDLLSNAKNLFHASMDEIRLIDINSINETTKNTNNKNRATTLPIWEYIKNSYDIEEFLQIDTPIARIKREISIYSETKFKDEYIQLLRKAFIHLVQISKEYLNELYDEAKDSLNKSNNNIATKRVYVDVKINDGNNSKNLRLLNSKELIEPVKVISVNTLGDYALIEYLKETRAKKDLSKHHNNIYIVTLAEARRRGLIS